MHLDPTLTWDGKAEHTALFESAEENLPLREAIDFYRHAHAWSNRLIAGDSLLLMNSLIEKEGMAGKVQYGPRLDPCLGIQPEREEGRWWECIRLTR